MNEKNFNSNLRVPNMQLHELAATCHCPPHLLIHVGREEIRRLLDSRLLMQCEAVI